MFNSFLATNGSYAETLQVGDSYGGGIVGYILQYGDPGWEPNRQHGLIISPTTPPLVEDAPGSPCWPSGYPWNYQNVGTQPNLTSLSAAIGTGQANTDIIVSTWSPYGSICTYIPGKLCEIYTNDGFSDWYLPSLNELTAIGANRALLPDWNYGYWTSTQVNQNNAYVVNTSTNAVQSEPKWSDGGGARYFRYRPTRSF
jgi:hypothetical protein